MKTGCPRLSKCGQLIAIMSGLRAPLGEKKGFQRRIVRDESSQGSGDCSKL